jgi:hypothetical protein
MSATATTPVAAAAEPIRFLPRPAVPLVGRGLLSEVAK